GAGGRRAPRGGHPGLHRQRSTGRPRRARGAGPRRARASVNTAALVGRAPRRRLAGGKGRRGRVVIPSLVSGVGLALSLPPWGFWVLAFPAAGLLWWRLGGLRWRQRLLAGWTAGVRLFL